jgi:hypothetical protein
MCPQNPTFGYILVMEKVDLWIYGYEG